MPGVFGSLQALEALKRLLGLPGLTPGEMLIFDLVTLEHAATARTARSRTARRISARAAAAPSPAPRELEVQFGSLADARGAPASRSSTCVTRASAPPIRCRPPALHLPMSKLLTDAATLDPDGRYLLICATGKRSAAAAELLRSQGLRECRSLRGGLKGLKAIRLKRVLPTARVLVCSRCQVRRRRPPIRPIIRCSSSRANCSRAPQARSA